MSIDKQYKLGNLKLMTFRSIQTNIKYFVKPSGISNIFSVQTGFIFALENEDTKIPAVQQFRRVK